MDVARSRRAATNGHGEPLLVAECAIVAALHGA
jgi:hypothetical protein